MSDIFSEIPSTPGPTSAAELSTRLTTPDVGNLDYLGSSGTLGWLGNAMRSLGHAATFGQGEAPRGDINARAEEAAGFLPPEMTDPTFQAEALAANPEWEPTVRVFEKEADAKQSPYYLPGFKTFDGMSEERLRSMYEDYWSRKTAESMVEGHQAGASSVLGFFTQAAAMADPTWFIPWTQGVFGLGRIGGSLGAIASKIGPTAAQGLQFAADNAISTAMTRPLTLADEQGLGLLDGHSLFLETLKETAMAGLFGGVVGAGIFGKMARNFAKDQAAFMAYSRGLDQAAEQLARGIPINVPQVTQELKQLYQVGSKHGMEGMRAAYEATPEAWKGITTVLDSKLWEPALAGLSSHAEAGSASFRGFDPVWMGEAMQSAAKPGAPAQKALTRQEIIAAATQARKAEEAAPVANRVEQLMRRGAYGDGEPEHVARSPLFKKYQEAYDQTVGAEISRAEVLKEARGAGMTPKDLLGDAKIQLEYQKVRGKWTLTDESKELMKLVPDHTFGAQGGVSAATLEPHPTKPGVFVPHSKSREASTRPVHNVEGAMGVIQENAPLLFQHDQYIPKELRELKDFIEGFSKKGETNQQLAAAMEEARTALKGRVEELLREHDGMGRELTDLRVRERDLNNTYRGKMREVLAGHVEAGIIPPGTEFFQHPGAYDAILAHPKGKKIHPEVEKKIIGELKALQDQHRQEIAAARQAHSQDGQLMPDFKDPSISEAELHASMLAEAEAGRARVEAGDFHDPHAEDLGAKARAEMNPEDALYDGTTPGKAYQSISSVEANQNNAIADKHLEAYLERAGEMNPDTKARIAQLDKEMAEASQSEMHMYELMDHLEDCD